jgi:hypothetical protein
LLFHNQNIEEMPLVFQYNKRDLRNILSLERLNDGLNHLHRPYFEAVASSGRGVIETLRDISSLTLVKIKEALEHAMVSTRNLAVNFDVDSSHQILKMKDLPMKKISMEAMPAVEPVQGLPQTNESAAPAPAPAHPPTPRRREERRAVPPSPRPRPPPAPPTRLGSTDPRIADRHPRIR